MYVYGSYSPLHLQKSPESDASLFKLDDTPAINLFAILYSTRSLR